MARADTGHDTADDATTEAAPGDAGGAPGFPYGAACTLSDGCPGGLCVTTDLHPFFEGGYCSMPCDPASPECGAGSSCFDLKDLGFPGLCVKRCETDAECRPPQYVCAGSCIPGGFLSALQGPGLLSGDEPDMLVALDAVDFGRVMRRLRVLTGDEPWDGPAGPVTIKSRSIFHPDHAVAMEFLESELASTGATVERVEFPGPGGTVVTDIVATLPGSDPSAAPVLVGAHWDSTAAWTPGWDAATDPSPGASDNGTGVVAALEVASVLSAVTRRATVRVVLFDGEEDGLLGSFGWTDSGMDAGACLLNVDMVGAAPEPLAGRFFLQYDADLPADMPALAFEAIERFVNGVRAIPTGFTDTGGSDSEPFWDHGECSVALIAWPRPGANHTVEDTVATIDPGFFSAVVRAVVAAALAWSR